MYRTRQALIMFQKDNNKNVSTFVKTLGKQSDQVPDRISLSPKRDTQHKEQDKSNEINLKNQNDYDLKEVKSP